MDYWYPVTFSTNFKGLGLPASIYGEFVTLFEYVTEDEVVCSNTLDGICVLPAPCENYTAYSEFAFKFNFSRTPYNNYMNVPLGAFAENVKVSGGATTCQVYVTYLDEYASQSESIILGGMWMQEFFTVYTNDYSSLTADVQQSARIYVGQNAKLDAYVGNQVLPIGVNPFKPPEPEPPIDYSMSVGWVVVLSLVSAALIGFLGYSLYKWKMAKLEMERRAANRSGDVNNLEGVTLNNNGVTMPMMINASGSSSQAPEIHMED